MYSYFIVHYFSFARVIWAAVVAGEWKGKGYEYRNGNNLFSAWWKKGNIKIVLCTKCKLMHQINHIVIELSFFQGVPGLEGRKGNKGEIGEKGKLYVNGSNLNIEVGCLLRVS